MSHTEFDKFSLSMQVCRLVRVLSTNHTSDTNISIFKLLQNSNLISETMTASDINININTNDTTNNSNNPSSKTSLPLHLFHNIPNINSKQLLECFQALSDLSLELEIDPNSIIFNPTKDEKDLLPSELLDRMHDEIHQKLAESTLLLQDMPMDVLSSILSFLPILEIVRSSIFSHYFLQCSRSPTAFQSSVLTSKQLHNMLTRHLNESKNRFVFVPHKNFNTRNIFEQEIVCLRILIKKIWHLLALHSTCNHFSTDFQTLSN